MTTPQPGGVLQILMRRIDRDQHVINHPRSNDPYTLHPQRDYLHDIHGTYATFNLKTIEPPQLRFHHCNATYPYNHYLVFGLQHIEKHYAQLHMSLFYHTYVSDMPDLSIAPNMWIYHDRQLNHTPSMSAKTLPTTHVNGII